MPNPTDKILSLLIKQKDGYASGQAMAEKLGVTRAAVWKAIEALREASYGIESVRAKGYRLASVPDILGEREIQLGLKTKVLGRKIIYYPETDSTNTRASRLAAEGEPEGTVVVADSQTAGRGRLGRTWVSPPGVNIYLSLILRPPIPPAEAPLTTLAAAVASAKAVKGLYNIPCGIKWPNDLLINGKKAVGILTEMSAEPDMVRHIVLGIGFDVNMPREAFPPEIREISTSVMLEAGKKANRAELVRRFLEEFEAVYGLLVKGARDKILEKWRQNSVTFGRKVRVVGLKGEKTGIATDITGSGSLILENERGETEEITSGDVWFTK